MKTGMSTWRKNGLLLFKVVTVAIFAGFLHQYYSTENVRTDEVYIVSANLLISTQGTASKSSENQSMKISFTGLILDGLQIALLEINSILLNTFTLLTNRERNVYYVFTRINAP